MSAAEFAQRPSKTQLLESGEYVGPMSIEEYLSWRKGAGSPDPLPGNFRPHCRLWRTAARDCRGERCFRRGAPAFCQRPAGHHAGNGWQGRCPSGLGPPTDRRQVRVRFFVLAGLYDGWSLPLAVIKVVPMSRLFALAGVARVPRLRQWQPRSVPLP